MPLFIPITKVNIAQRLVHGTLSEEIPDKTGEILDYESSKPAFQEWSRQFHEASGGKSLGNVRAMHGNIAVGKLTDICFDDENKRIEGVAKVVDEDAWNKVMEGVYTGFSIGGGYAKRWKDAGNPALMRYTPTLSEVSLVDNPAVPTATFSVIKQDGSTELRRFVHAAMAKATPTFISVRDCLQWLLDQETTEEVMQNAQAIIDWIDNPDAVEKSLADATPKLPDCLELQTAFDALCKRVEQLEKQPVAPKSALKCLQKSHDYVDLSEDIAALTFSASVRM